VAKVGVSSGSGGREQGDMFRGVVPNLKIHTECFPDLDSSGVVRVDNSIIRFKMFCLRNSTPDGDTC
jgi:hypothetical protein